MLSRLPKGAASVSPFFHFSYLTRGFSSARMLFPSLVETRHERDIFNFLTKQSSQTKSIDNPIAWLIGPEGSGKRTTVYNMKSRIVASKLKPLLFLSFDFGSEIHSNLQILTCSFLRSIREQLNEQWKAVGFPLEWVFTALTKQFPDFPDSVKHFVQLLTNRNAYTSFSLDSGTLLSLKALLNSYGESRFDKRGWTYLLKLLQTECPAFCDYIGSPNSINIALFIAFEAPNLGDVDPNMYPVPDIKKEITRRLLGIEYALYLLNAIREESSVSTNIFLSNVEVLYRSTYLASLGSLFFESLLKLILQKYPVPHLLATSDSLFYLNFVGLSKQFVDVSNINNDCVNPMDKRDKQIIQMKELSKEAACAPFKSLVSDTNILNGIWKAVGGNVKLLQKIAQHLSIFNYQIDLELKRFTMMEDGADALLAQYGLDAAEYESNPKIDDLIKERRAEKQREFLRCLMDVTLKEEYADFQWRMNYLFSMKGMEELRQQSSDGLRFYSTVYEMIRYIVDSPSIPFDPLQTLNHPVIQGLLETRLLTIVFDEHPQLAVSNAFFACLMKSYASLFYDSLSFSDKIKYDAISFAVKKQIAAMIEGSIKR